MAKLETIDARMRVVVVDDDESTCIYLKEVLQSARNFSFAGSFSNATEVLIEIPRLRPDLALLDIGLPDLNGVECTKRLKEMMPRLKIVIIS